MVRWINGCPRGTYLVAAMMLTVAADGCATPQDAAPAELFCAMDARQCPDGTWVGRTGPNCEFECPTPDQGARAPSPTELKYLLIDRFPDVFYCDPDFYPVPREDETVLALQKFPEIEENREEFATILRRLGLSPGFDYSPEQKLRVYREHKTLNYGVSLQTDTVGPSRFVLNVGPEGDGTRIEGTIGRQGDVHIVAQQPAFLSCPICLPGGAAIMTPSGPIGVEVLEPGMSVVTVDEAGLPTVATILRVGRAPVPPTHRVARIALRDGRAFTASLGHPTADGRILRDLVLGEAFAGSRIVSIETVRYEGGYTYDLLPSGPSGVYFVGDVPLASSLRS